MLIKYNGGPHGYIQQELALFDIQTLDEACTKPCIEMKGKNMQAFREQKNPFHMTQAEQRADGEKTPKQCSHCHKIGHTNEDCWSLHRELLPKNRASKKCMMVEGNEKD